MQVAPELWKISGATADTWDVGYQACFVNCFRGMIPLESDLFERQIAAWVPDSRVRL
jgi:hypothetical protein